MITSILFQRGQDTSEDVPIDHVVALSDAWQKGTQGWNATQRTTFADDPLNLLAADGPLNMAKGDGDAATWLPPNMSYRCGYVARQVAVKVSYDLWMTQAETNASATVLSSCPDQPLPDGVVADLPEPSSPPAPAPAVHYQSCDAVRAAGAAPMQLSDPGWQQNSIATTMARAASSTRVI